MEEDLPWAMMRRCPSMRKWPYIAMTFFTVSLLVGYQRSSTVTRDKVRYAELTLEFDRPSDQEFNMDMTDALLDVSTTEIPIGIDDDVVLDDIAAMDVMHVVDKETDNGSVLPTADTADSPADNPTNTAIDEPPTYERSSPQVVENPNVDESSAAAESPTVVQEPSDSPTVVQEPSDIPTVVQEPSDSPTVVQEPSDSPTVVQEPSDSPTVVQEPSDNESQMLNETQAAMESPAVVQNVSASVPLSLILKNRTASPVLNILLWNHFFLHMDYGVGVGTEPFRIGRCSKKCNIVTDRAHLNKSAAVLVHMFFLPKDVPNATLPVRANDKQIFVFFNLENPVRNRRGLEALKYNDVFNLTFTYLDSPDTDLYTPYGGVRKMSKPFPYIIPKIATIEKKTKDVVWLVSNCKAPSSRYEYVQALSKYIKVDILGKCGEDVCPKGAGCLEWLSTDYKFYLSFENGFCQDYITEKAFKILSSTTMIPIVHGGGNYSKVMPPKSYIDVRDFASPKDLGLYLLKLSKDPEALREYMTWKGEYEVLSVTYYKLMSFCKLCEGLHDNSFKYKSHFNPQEYWDADKMCLEGEAERKAVHLI